jgi:heme-degrading monooxygenase HmoA
MYAVVNHLHLNIPVEDLVEPLEREGAPLLASQPGFLGFHLVKAGENHAIVVLLWESLEAAQKGAATFGPTWFAKNIAPQLASEQQRDVGEVVVSRVG